MYFNNLKIRKVTNYTALQLGTYMVGPSLCPYCKWLVILIKPLVGR